MADDQLFDKTGEGTPAKEPAKEPTGDKQTAVTQEDLTKAMGTLREELAQPLDGLRKGLEALKPTKEPEPEPTLTDKQQALLQDPDAYIDSRAGKAVKEKVDPETQVLLRDKQALLVRTHQEAIDKEFGEGVFEAELQKDLEAVLGSMTPAMRASEAHVSAAVNGLIGAKRGTLFEKRAETMKKGQDIPSVMTGVGRPRPSGPSLSPEEKEGLERLAEKGIDYSAKQYLIDRDAGDTEDDFPEALKEKAE
jgi:hypothetical protein